MDEKPINYMMNGLYKRALSIRRQQQLLNVIKRNGSASQAGLDIPESESEEILTQIDQVVAKNKLKINESTFSFHARKKGFGLPLLVNLITLAVIGAGIFLFSYYFNVKEESIVTGIASITSAEGRLIDKIKEESEAKIALKNEEIETTRLKLQEIASEKDKLESEFDLRIQKREEELRAALESELDAERERLAEEGMSQEEIDRLISEIESSRSAEYSRQLEAFREEAELELEEKSAAIAALTDEYERTLSRQENEKEELTRELAAREAELEAQLQEQQAALEQERSAFSDDLTRIQKQQENRQLVLDQIQSSYETVNGLLNKADYEEALNQLAVLEEYLNKDTIRGLSYLQDRIQVEFFIIDSLRKLIQSEQDAASSETDSLVQAASELTSVSGIVEEADTLFQDGEIDRATEMYLAALNEIPDLSRSYQRLQEIEEMTFQRRRDELSRIISSGDNLYSSGDYRASLRQYQEALDVLREDSVDFNRMVERISEAGYRIGLEETTIQDESEAADLMDDAARLHESGDYGAAITTYSTVLQRYTGSSYQEAAMEGLQKSMQTMISQLESDIATAEQELDAMEERRTAETDVEAVGGGQESAEMIRRLDSIKALYAGYSEFSEGTGERSQEELYSLLQAKLLMKRVLNSEEVRAEHPELYDSVQQYYEAYGEERWQEGRYATMRDIIAFIDILANPESYSETDVTETTADFASQDELFTEFLDKLQALIQ